MSQHFAVQGDSHRFPELLTVNTSYNNAFWQSVIVMCVVWINHLNFWNWHFIYLDWYFVFNNIFQFLTWYFSIWIFCPQWSTIPVLSLEICCAIFCAICPQCLAIFPILSWNIRSPVKWQLLQNVVAFFLCLAIISRETVYKRALEFYIRIP